MKKINFSRSTYFSTLAGEAFPRCSKERSVRLLKQYVRRDPHTMARLLAEGWNPHGQILTPRQEAIIRELLFGHTAGDGQR